MSDTEVVDFIHGMLVLSSLAFLTVTMYLRAKKADKDA